MKISTKTVLISLISASAFLSIAAFSQQIKPKNTYQTTGSGSGKTTAKAEADCGGGTLLAGGGSCRSEQGLVGISSSYPNGNLWSVSCESSKSELVFATAIAICSGKKPSIQSGVELTAFSRQKVTEIWHH